MNYKMIFSNLVLLLFVYLGMKVLGFELTTTLVFIGVLVIINLISNYFIAKKNYFDFIEKNLKIAKNDLIDQYKVAIVVTKGKNVVWANSYAYKEFPELLSNQRMEAINLVEGMDKLKFKNKIYNVEQTESTYFLTNITNEQRAINQLEKLQLVIGLLQIDNYYYLESTMPRDQFSEMDVIIKREIYKKLTEYGIYYQEISDDKFHLNIPIDVLNKQQDKRFPFIQEIVDIVGAQNFETSLSFGIATNYESVLMIGTRAQEALDLAISRGGGQIVIFNAEKRKYIGGKITAVKSSSKLRSRVVFNTIKNMIKDRDCLYLVTHKYADYDGLASMMILSDLIRNVNERIEIKILVDETTDQKMLAKFHKLKNLNIAYSTVIDKTQTNLLIVVDTQAKDYLSHPQVFSQIDDVIVIDHHQTPENYIGTSLFSWIEPSVSSTVEMLLEIMISQQYKMTDKERVKFALLGILTDTNNFLFRTDRNTLEATSYLVGMGVEIVQALEEIEFSYEQFTERQALINQANFEKNICIVEANYNVESVMMSIVGNELLKIDGIDCVLLTAPTNNNNKYNVKLRTSSKINSKRVIEEFGGGGHASQAAGVLTYEQINDLKKLLMRLEI
ncbi:MAG: DHH family phosphoesterase [Mycoplasmatales bacterium]